MPHPCGDLVAVPGSDDVICQSDAWLSRVGPQGEVRWQARAGKDPLRTTPGMAVEGRHVWVACGTEVVRVALDDGRIVERIASRAPRSIVVTSQGAWWLEHDPDTVLGPGGFRKVYDGAFVSNLVSGPDEPLLLRGSGTLADLRGGVLVSVDRVTYDALRFEDGATWTLGASSMRVDGPGAVPEPLGPSEVLVTSRREEDAVALGAASGAVYVAAGAAPEPGELLRLPGGDGLPAFDLRRGAGGRLEVLRAHADRVVVWAMSGG